MKSTYGVAGLTLVALSVGFWGVASQGAAGPAAGRGGGEGR